MDQIDLDWKWPTGIICLCLCHFSPRGHIEDISKGAHLLPGVFWGLSWHICEDIASVAHICLWQQQGTCVFLLLFFCQMYKNICCPSDKIFFWMRTLWNLSLCSLRQCGFGVWNNVWSFKWTARCPDLSPAEMCGTFGGKLVSDMAQWWRVSPAGLNSTIHYCPNISHGYWIICSPV